MLNVFHLAFNTVLHHFFVKPVIWSGTHVFMDPGRSPARSWSPEVFRSVMCNHGCGPFSVGDSLCNLTHYVWLDGMIECVIVWYGMISTRTLNVVRRECTFCVFIEWQYRTILPSRATAMGSILASIFTSAVMGKP